MKRLLLILLLFITSFVFAQTTKNPKITKKSNSELFLHEVKLSDEYTILTMSFFSYDTKDNFYPYKSTTNMTIAIDTESYLLDKKTGKKYNYIKAEGIPEKPYSMIVKNKNAYHFVLYYQRLENDTTEFDFIERDDADDPFTKIKYWKFYGIKLNPK